MPTNNKPNATSPRFSPEQIAAALAAAPQATEVEDIDWSDAVITEGGGIRATLDSLHRQRGPNKRLRKEQVAVRFSPEVLAYFRAQGRGWQTRMDEALKEFIASHPKS
ncbi:MAG: BrnA antitoxin family protein [Methylococcaceae bacterium]|nr:BrnA antitoxin family protein [Methylococcaceae bacterium]